MATDYGSVDKVEQAKNLAILRREEAQDEQPRPVAGIIAAAATLAVPLLCLLGILIAKVVQP